MNYAAIMAAGPVIQLHLVATLAALPLGIVMLVRRKGTLSHRRLGWVWVILMATAAVSSLWIRTIHPGHFSPIHILSVVTLAALPIGIYAIRRGNVRRHRWTMITLFASGLVVAGIFTLLPGRLLGHMLFGAG